MKSIIEYINESSDIADKFISYLKENAKKIGKLPTNHKSYYDYFNECNPFDNNKFSLNVSNMVYADDYCEEHDIDDVSDDEEGFIEYVKNIVDEQLTLEFERGLIKCERVIKLNNSDFNKNLGVYWSYVEGMGDSHGAIGSGTNITLIGLVDPKDVNWEETIAANLIDPEEYEFNLIEDSEIEITKIINTKTKDVLFEGHLICNI